MDEPNIESEVVRLDGYLSGLAALISWPVKIVLCALIMTLAAGCGRTDGISADPDQELPSVAVPPPPDVGDIAAFQGCEAVPRRTLSSTELCQVGVLRKRCLPADDCLVTCIGSPDARRLEGGCAHACFSYLHKSWSEPKGYADCGQG